MCFADEATASSSVLNAGLALFHLGDLDQALLALIRAMDLYLGQEDYTNSCVALSDVVLVLREQNRLALAERCLILALEWAQRSSMPTRCSSSGLPQMMGTRSAESGV